MNDKQLVGKLRQKYMQNPPKGEFFYKVKKLLWEQIPIAINQLISNKFAINSITFILLLPLSCKFF